MQGPALAGGLVPGGVAIGAAVQRIRAVNFSIDADGHAPFQGPVFPIGILHGLGGGGQGPAPDIKLGIGALGAVDRQFKGEGAFGGLPAAVLVSAVGGGQHLPGDEQPAIQPFFLPAAYRSIAPQDPGQGGGAALQRGGFGQALFPVKGAAEADALLLGHAQLDGFFLAAGQDLLPMAADDRSRNDH